MVYVGLNVYFVVQFVVVFSSREPWLDKQSIQCRDIENVDTDWWYVYKSPANPIPEKPLSSEQISTNQTTGVFTYITPDESGTWEIPDINDSGNGFDMLQYTLAPIFKSKFTRRGLAVLVFDYRDGNDTYPGTDSSGILIANDFGGVYVGHTVPGLIDEASARLLFPENELRNGHLFICLSLSMDSVNDFATVLRVIKPKVTYKVIPDHYAAKLRNLDLIDDDQPYTWSELGMPFIITTTKGRSFIIYHRSPTNNKCLFTEHAKLQTLIMDVYDHRDQDHSNYLDYCNDKSGLRTIKYISLKTQKYIQYIKKHEDKSTFAVSTAARWQERPQGRNTQEYWICVSNVGRSGGQINLGAMLICTEHYDIWRAFMNMKVDEPRCVY